MIEPYFQIRFEPNEAIERFERFDRRFVPNGHHEKMDRGTMEQPLYKMTDNARVTPIGRFLRKTSLDELRRYGPPGSSLSQQLVALARPQNHPQNLQRRPLRQRSLLNLGHHVKKTVLGLFLHHSTNEST